MNDGSDGGGGDDEDGWGGFCGGWGLGYVSIVCLQ